ncbi:tyrosinase family protein [Jiella sp. M17.18]|uniref:tyrosinase family protein n=1 Tax=Jiella sp. M17.18 TaxID=3234247 RepID=UPI0034DED64A
MVTRRNVYALGGDWAEPILWYARGVAAMKARPLAEPTSWRFYGAIHGFDSDLWQQLGYLDPNDPLPSDPLVQEFWRQCQHGSWYFLPWHRGYLIAFEANVRAAIADLGGPAAWALPYWNYFGTGQSALPPAFASPDWPDGQGDNPLFVSQRYGPNNDGNVFVPIDGVNLDALGDPEFEGTASGGSTGFGGVDTGFSHGGNVFGGLESQPHNNVHVLVGGADPQAPGLLGLMTDPDTAGLDPIFWLHHANIDRLWASWRRDPQHVDPNSPNWVDGPARIGERAFSMPMPGGETYDYTPGEMSDLAALGYDYDDLTPGAAAPQPVPPAQRLARLGIAPQAAAAMVGARQVAQAQTVEMVGANDHPMSLSGGDMQTSVKLDDGMRSKVVTSFAAAAAPGASPSAPDRMFLNLENVTGVADATTLKVYLGLPEGADPADHPDHLAGSVSLFGVRKATVGEGEHAGQGLTFVLEVTKIVDAMHLANRFDAEQLPVRIVPMNPVPDAAKVSIGRVSLFRQGG